MRQVIVLATVGKKSSTDKKALEAASTGYCSGVVKGEAALDFVRSTDRLQIVITSRHQKKVAELNSNAVRLSIHIHTLQNTVCQNGKASVQV